jgi:predicted ABC-type ATPase
MREITPKVVVLAGPNGAGKSTIAQRLLPSMRIRHFVNADTIARGLSAFDPESVALAAGRIMLDWLHQLAERRESFAFETTLSTRSFAPWIKGLIAKDYQFRLHYLWLPNADMAVSRVADRVRKGGHHVPDETVRRRYNRGVRNFYGMYRPMAWYWAVYDNTSPDRPDTIAEGSGLESPEVYDENKWQAIQQTAAEERPSSDRGGVAHD